MGKINSGPANSLLFEYDTNLIGDINSDTEYLILKIKNLFGQKILLESTLQDG